jgi:hypothetical protein
MEICFEGTHEKHSDPDNFAIAAFEFSQPDKIELESKKKRNPPQRGSFFLFALHYQKTCGQRSTHGPRSAKYFITREIGASPLLSRG